MGSTTQFQGNNRESAELWHVNGGLFIAIWRVCLQWSSEILQTSTSVVVEYWLEKYATDEGIAEDNNEILQNVWSPNMKP